MGKYRAPANRATSLKLWGAAHKGFSAKLLLNTKELKFVKIVKTREFRFVVSIYKGSQNFGQYV